MVDRFMPSSTRFAEIESIHDEPILYGVTDGKAVGTYLEHKFTAYLAQITVINQEIQHQVLIFLLLKLTLNQALALSDSSLSAWS